MIRFLQNIIREDGQPPFSREEIVGGLCAMGALLAINAFIGLVEMLIR